MGDELKGKSVSEFRSKSFYLDGSLVSEYLMLFLHIEGVWYSITIVDGFVQLTRENAEPVLTKDFDKDFSYPISDVEILKKYAGLQVVSVLAYRIPEIDDGILGLYVSYGSVGFSYYNMDDFSYITEGVAASISERAVLVEYTLPLP